MDGDEAVRALARGGDARLGGFAPLRDGSEEAADRIGVLARRLAVAERPGPAEEDAGSPLPVEKGLLVHVDVPAAAVEAEKLEPERHRPPTLRGSFDTWTLRRNKVQKGLPSRALEIAVVGPEGQVPVGAAVFLYVGEEV